MIEQWERLAWGPRDEEDDYEDDDLDYADDEDFEDDLDYADDEDFEGDFDYEDDEDYIDYDE